MATIEEALRTKLTGAAAVTALLAASGAVYPLVIPQGSALPAIAYQRISTGRGAAHSSANGLAMPRMQFSCVATTYAGARALANAVRQELDLYRGTVDDVWIDAIFVENEIDQFNFETDQNESSYAVVLDAIVWHAEA